MSSQIRDGQRVFYAQMTSRALHYDGIYHSFPINCQYLNTWVVVTALLRELFVIVQWDLYIYIKPLYNKVSGITNIRKIQLVFYYQCFVLIG